MSRSKGPAPSPENTIEPAAVRAQQQSLALDPSAKANDDGPRGAGIRAELPTGSKDRRSPNPSQAPDPTPKDTTTIPAAVRDRFLQVGEKWFFPNGDPAFKDLGGRLTTRSENAEIVRSLVEIAHARGWDEITVGGTKDFKRAVWHEAALQKISVRGYTPTEIDEARFVRAMARRAEVSREHDSGGASRTAVSEELQPEPVQGRRRRRQPQEPQRALQDAEGGRRAAPEPGEAGSAAKKVIYGRLVEHGAENYKLDPNEDMSYFVKLRTADDRIVTLWGLDLERAIHESKSQPKLGDRVGVRQVGEKPVTVSKKERDGQGNVVREYDLSTHRNKWVVETEQFFHERAKLADVVRDSTVDARRAVDDHPELAGTYTALHGAELLAERLGDRQSRDRFMETMRKTLAREIRQGDPLYVPALRDKPRTADRAATPSPAAPEVSPVR